MATIEKDKKKSFDDFNQDYSVIVKTVEKTTFNTQEWSKKGDFFTKYTLYQEYTPVKTSCNTTLFEAS